MLVSDFDFELPEHLIAQEPRPRGGARLLVVDRAGGTWYEATIAAVPSLLAPGDLVVANDTRVFPARLIGRRDPSERTRQLQCVMANTRQGLIQRRAIQSDVHIQEYRLKLLRLAIRTNASLKFTIRWSHLEPVQVLG